jgi:hypothetical protein
VREDLAHGDDVEAFGLCREGRAGVGKDAKVELTRALRGGGGGLDTDDRPTHCARFVERVAVGTTDVEERARREAVPVDRHALEAASRVASVQRFVGGVALIPARYLRRLEVAGTEVGE